MLLRYIAKRMPYVIPQLFGIILVSFFMVKLIPGDPAVMMLGPTASQQSLAALRDKMGLSKPLWQQFAYYIGDVLHGNLGTSWQTTRPVTEDLLQRFPATLELVTFGLLLAIAIGFPLGVAASRLQSGPVRKFADYYGLLAGAMPDFWLALVLIYIFYTRLGLDRGTARTHRSGSGAAKDDYRQSRCRQPPHRQHRRALFVIRTSGAAGADAGHHQRRTDSEDDANHGDPRSVF